MLLKGGSFGYLYGSVSNPVQFDKYIKLIPLYFLNLFVQIINWYKKPLRFPGLNSFVNNVINGRKF